MPAFKMGSPKIVANNNGTTLVGGTCVFTGKYYEATYPTAGLADYMLFGDKVQDALPNSTPEDREWLISGISPDGWNQMFKE